MASRAEGVVRARLSRYGLHAKKGLGQHFLVDDEVLRDIARAATRVSESLIEIGPGLGTLTEELAEMARNVVALERDRDLVPLLRRELVSRTNVEILEGDALTFDFFAVLQRLENPAFVGNLPYNISTPLLFRILETRGASRGGTFMVQREVAERLTAHAKEKAYGVLGVMFGLHAKVENLFEVPPDAFLPPPKVFSTVIRVDWRDAPAVSMSDEPFFRSVVKAAFGQRRKTLRNALTARWSREIVAAAESGAGFSFDRRAETLTLEEFGLLAESLSSAAPENSEASEVLDHEAFASAADDQTT